MWFLHYYTQCEHLYKRKNYLLCHGYVHTVYLGCHGRLILYYRPAAQKCPPLVILDLVDLVIGKKYHGKKEQQKKRIIFKIFKYFNNIDYEQYKLISN